MKDCLFKRIAAGAASLVILLAAVPELHPAVLYAEETAVTEVTYIAEPSEDVTEPAATEESTEPASEPASEEASVQTTEVTQVSYETVTTAAETTFTETTAPKEKYTVRFSAENGFVIYVPGENGLWQQTFSLTVPAGSDVEFKVDGTPFRTVKIGEKFVPSSGDTYTISDVMEDTVVRIANGNYSTAFSIQSPYKASADYAVLSMRTPAAAARLYYAKIPYADGQRISTKNVVEAVTNSTDPRIAGIYDLESPEPLKLYENGFYYFVFENEDGTYKNGAYTCTVKQIDRAAPTVSADFVSYVQEMNGGKVAVTKFRAVFTAYDNNTYEEKVNTLSGLADASEFYLVNDLSIRNHALSNAVITAIEGTADKFQITAEYKGEYTQDIYLIVRDKAGNEAYAEIRTDNITTDNIMLRVSYDVSDLGQRCEVNAEAPDHWQLSYQTNDRTSRFDNKFNITDEGRIYTVIAGMDGSEIGRTAGFSVNGLDKQPPEIIIADGYNAKWRDAGNTNIRIQLSEAGSTLYYYRTDEPVTDGIYDFTSYATISEKNTIIEVEAPSGESGIWYYYFYGVDRHGNKTNVVIYVYMLDAEAPVFDETDKPVYIADESYGFIQLIANTLSFDMFFDEYACAAFNASDTGGSGIAGYQYTFGDEWTDIVPETSAEGYEAYTSFIKLPANADGALKIKVTDNAGNETIYDFADGTVGTNVLINSQTPDVPDMIAEKTDGSEYIDGEWTNQSVKITLSGSAVEYDEGSFINPQKFQFSTDGITWEEMPETDSSITDTVQGGTVNNVLRLGDELNETYSFRAAGYNGRISDTCGITVRVDKTPPENAVYTVNGTMGVLPDGSESGWYTDISSEFLVTITAPAVDGGSPVKTWYRLSKDGDKAEVTEFTGDNQPLFSGDGIYSFEMWTADEAGNICTDTVITEIKVDTTAPVYQELYAVKDGSTVPILAETDDENNSTAVMKYYFSEAINIVTSFDFGISGRHQLQYAFSDSASLEAAESLVWYDYDSSKGITAEPDMRFYLYVKASDSAGNVTMVNSDGIIIDSVKPSGMKYAPEIDIIPEPYHYGQFYNRDLEVNICAADPMVTGDEELAVEKDVYSGLKLVEYKVYNEGIVTQSGSADLTEGDASAKKIITIDSSLNNTNDVIVEVRAVDMAGNERTTRTAAGRIRIDTVPPSVSVSYSDEPSAVSGGTSYFNKARTAVIRITERNFSPADVAAAITSTGGSVPVISGWSVSGSGDNTEYTGTVTYSADGDYTFDVSFTDMAGNRCRDISYSGSAPVRFTIDQTKPVVNVEFNNNDEMNDGYFAEKRTAVITIREHNFSSSGVSIAAARDGRSVLSDGLVWETRGDIHRATVVFEDDGVYTFDVVCTDLAANESDETDYGESIYPRQFTIDKTIEAPLILVNGRSCDGGAYSGEAVISFSFGDVNYSAHSIKLTHTSMGSTRDVTDELIGNVTVSDGSCSVTLDNIPENDQAYDGIYTLSLAVADLAGHSEKTEAAFSVNRYGSVYVFDEYLSSLIDGGVAYVKKLDDNIVITEYNANRLKEGSLSIIITRDGRPVDVIDTDVQPVINNKVQTGESGWYQYRYVISMENFASDGVYKIAVSSEDEAGNTPENTNYDDQAISFCIDSTAPELASVTGLEKSIINDKEKHVRYSVFDTMGIRKLTVYIDGVQVDNVTDFSEDANNYSGEFVISESKDAQSVRIVVEDMAGNITDTDAKNFKPHYAFERIVTVSTNMFVRFYANKPLFWGIIGGIAAVSGAAGLIVFLRKKKKAAQAA